MELPQHQDDDLEVPLKLRDPLTEQHVAAQRQRVKEAREVQRKVKAAGATASRRLDEQQSGLMQRGSLFDGDDWKKTHAARQQSMENTFSELYKPQGSAYWKQAQPPQRKLRAATQAARSGMGVPSWAGELPHALSLGHPAFRQAVDDLAGVEPAEAPAQPAADAQPKPAEAFDPMAAPEQFFRNFKQRLGELRSDVGNPPQYVDVTPAAPAAAPAAEPAAPAPAAADDDLEPSAIYLTSLEFLAEKGIDIPSWDAPFEERGRREDAGGRGELGKLA